jgi:hypothetical protein
LETPCIDSEGIADVVELPADHPTRRHVEDCPRCRNLLRSYQKFVSAEPVAGAGIADAHHTLDALIASKVGKRSAVTRPSSMRLAGVFRGFLRPAPLVAAAAVCALVTVVVWQQSRGPESLRLRSQPTSQTSGLPPADVRPDGSIHLSWAAVPGADAYQVRIYGPNFTEIYRHPSVAETSVVIDRSSLPSDLPPQLDVLWRVYALQTGDVIGTSEPGSIRIR